MIDKEQKIDKPTYVIQRLKARLSDLEQQYLELEFANIALQEKIQELQSKESEEEKDD